MKALRRLLQIVTFVGTLMVGVLIRCMVSDVHRVMVHLGACHCY